MFDVRCAIFDLHCAMLDVICAVFDDHCAIADLDMPPVSTAYFAGTGTTPLSGFLPVCVH
jgi:hypothetical protein